MDHERIAYWITIGDAVCWAICFFFMYRISSKQNSVLKELPSQAARIEKLSREEHALIREVHPRVSDIKAGVEHVIDEMKKAD